jgi:hypothetical protein
MALTLTDGSLFIHVPKTAGNWIRSVLEDNNLAGREIGHKHSTYDRTLLKETPVTSELDHLRSASRGAFDRLRRLLGGQPAHERTNQFRFCFVRHPLSWYESWWKYQERRDEWEYFGDQESNGDWHPNSTLNGLESPDFNEFVANVVRHRPGYVTELLFSYAKPGIDFIGKKENVRDDLRTVLDKLGLSYDRSSIYDSEKVNVSTKEFEWDPELKETVKRLELPSLLLFDYLSEEEKVELGIDADVEPHAKLAS